MLDLWDRLEWYEERIKKQLLTLPKDWILLHLWDICIWRDTYWHNEIIQKLEYKKILVKWNHDRKSNTWYHNHWCDFVCDTFSLNTNNKHIIFSHKPVDLRTPETINIHWHMHKRFVKEALPIENRWCYSCEFEKYVPKNLDKILVELQQKQW